MNDYKSNRDAMDKAIGLARKTMFEDEGGPFGAAVLDTNGKVIGLASNSVLSEKDPTAHAEINAIRKACQVLNTHDLTGCTLVTTAYPCPMCLSAVIWANIKKIVYGCRLEDAEAIGFRDDFIYEFIRDGNKNKEILDLNESFRDECLELFKEYKENDKIIY
jgi:guanine deaminase